MRGRSIVDLTSVTSPWRDSVGTVSLNQCVIPNNGAFQPVEGSRAGLHGTHSLSTRDPFDFAQGRLFAPPEKRLRSG
jgi:hypothetical protein